MALHCNKWLSSHFFNWFSLSWCHLLVQMCFGTYLAVWTTAEMAGCPNWPSPHKSLWESQEKRGSNNHLSVKLNFLLVSLIHPLIENKNGSHFPWGCESSGCFQQWWSPMMWGRVVGGWNPVVGGWNPLVAGWNPGSPLSLLASAGLCQFLQTESNYVAFTSE